MEPDCAHVRMKVPSTNRSIRFHERDGKICDLLWLFAE